MIKIAEEESSKIIYKFNRIAEEVQKQIALITSKFNVTPQYILLGIDIEIAIRQYGYINNLLINPSKGAPFINDPCESALQKFFGLIPITDKSMPLRLPKDFIQVVVPPEAYS